MEDLVYTGDGEDAVLGGEEGLVEEVEEEWMVVSGGGGGGGRRRRERGSGSVPPSTPSIPLDEEQEEETHLVRPKSRSFHHSGSSSPWRKAAMSSAAQASNPPVEGIPFSSASVLSTLPASASTPNQQQENLHLSIPNLLSYSLSSLSDPSPPPPPPPPPSATPPLQVEPPDRTPPLLSPALSFLSAFSSPKSSIFLPSAASKPTSPDDQGQPAGSTPHILGKLLGQGGSGLVREVLDASTKERLNPPQAVKVVLHRTTSTTSSSSSSVSSSSSQFAKPTPERIAQEISLWSSISNKTHSNLVPLLAHHSSPHASYLFMPYMPNGSLFDLVKRHREHDRGRLAASGSAIMSSSFRARAGSNGMSRGVAALPEGEARRLFEGVVEGLRWLHKEEGIVHGDLKAENVLIDAEVSLGENELFSTRRTTRADSFSRSFFLSDSLFGSCRVAAASPTSV